MHPAPPTPPIIRPKEWIKKIHAMHLFDDGWEKLRETIFENQKKLGVIPADTQLEPWPEKVIKKWDDCTPEEKKLFIKQVEVFAAYEAYTTMKSAVSSRPSRTWASSTTP
jgi:arylsulfatase A-like enzyme